MKKTTISVTEPARNFADCVYQKAAGLTERIIAAAIEVHRNKGPGLIESIYEWCILQEFGLRSLACVSQKVVVIEYKGFTREEPLPCKALGARTQSA